MLQNRPSFSPLSSSWIEDPQPHYSALRDQAPVFFEAEFGAWVVSRHADVRRVLIDHQVFAADPRRAKLLVPEPVDSVQTVDPPHNSRLRHHLTQLVQPGKATADPTAMDAHARRELTATPGVDRDLVKVITRYDLAVICDCLGVQPPDQAWLDPISDELVAGMDAGLRPERHQAAIRARQQLSGMVEGWAVGAPQLVGAEENWSAAAISHQQRVNSVRVLFHAGYASLNGFLENVCVALLTDRGIREAYLALDRQARVDQAIPELLRWSSPVQGTTRIAVRDVELAGRQIAAGQPVLAMIASANWDPTVFRAPAQVNFARDTSASLGLGTGAHACLGRALIGAAAEAFLTELVGAGTAELLPGCVRRQGATLRGWQTLPVTGGLSASAS